ncbi:MAG: patatin-like phospholipase family protein, partial [Pseudomonadota bacterium]
MPLSIGQKDTILSWVAQAYAVGDCLRQFESEAAKEKSAGATLDTCAQKASTALQNRADELISDFRNSVQPVLNDLDRSSVDAPVLRKRIDKLRTSVAELGEAAVRNEIFSPVTWGIALSGGGVRSAAFNLGVLEALRVKGRWRDFDYMSTVSGGGYIGSALSFHNAKDRSCFPFFDRRGSRRSRRITWMRAHGSYLNRGKEVNTLTLAASIMKGVGLNVLFIVPLLIAVMWLLTLGCRESWRGLNCTDASGLLSQPVASLLIVIAAIAIVFTFQASKSRRTPDEFRLTVTQVLGGLLIAAVFVRGVHLALEAN